MALLTAILAAGMLAGCGDALLNGKALDGTAEKGAAVEETLVIPAWKLDLVADDGKGWWEKFGNFGAEVTDSIASAIWGVNQPQVTASQAQDTQRCPVIKLPASFSAAAKRRSWTSLYGEWTTPTGINLAAWEQNYLAMGFSRDVAKMGVSVRAASTGQVSLRTRLFTDVEMMALYDWKEPKAAASKETTANLAIFDCVGTLMYIVKEQPGFPQHINVYSRDGLLVSKSTVGTPVLRYQFTDPTGAYLIATAEAPGINATIKSADIPRDVEIGGVLPIGFFFEQGGFKNSSALMETEYRWVLTAAVQALSIYKAQADDMPWTVITVVETTIITLLVLSILAVVGVAFGIYRCVHPGGYAASKAHHDNPFLAVPPRPPPRAIADAAKTRLYGQDKALSYGANK